MAKVYAFVLDYGHRNTTPGKRTNCLPDRVIHERTMNEGYGKVLAARARAAGCLVLEVAPPADSAAPAPANGRNGEDTDLYNRINKANAWYKQLVAQYGADNLVCWYISCHANAASGTTAKGAEVWVYSKASQFARDTAKMVVDTLCKKSGMVNRGVKTGYVGNPNGDFAVNRETVMPAMLIEAGFMTTPAEADKMDKPEWWQTVGNAIADGLFSALRVPSAPTQPEQVSGDGFFECLANIACPIASANDLSLVLCLAQGGVESARGTSELAQNANNLFGIKKGSGWTGKIYSKITKEWVNGQYVNILGEFRQYDSWAHCVQDWAAKLTSMERYSNLVGCYDVPTACKYIQQDGWATSPTYTQTLISVVDQYGLMKYDNKEDKPMDFTSDKLIVGPMSGGDYKTIKALAQSLALGMVDDGDCLIIGPASTGDLRTLYAKATELKLGVKSYIEPAPAPEPEPEQPEDKPEQPTSAVLSIENLDEKAAALVLGLAVYLGGKIV